MITRFANMTMFAIMFDIANNPVRAGLVENPLDYAFTGSIGCDLLEVMAPTEA